MKIIRKSGFICALLLISAIVYAQRISINDISISQIRSEAEKDNAGCQFMLGYYYEVGQRLDKNISLAKYWYDRAIKNGYELAKIRLACLYDEEKDYDKSYPLWFSYANNKSNEDKTSANNVYNLSLYKVSLYKEEGIGTTIDITGAIEYGERAYNNGYVSILGILYSCYSVLKDANSCFVIAQRMKEKLGMSFNLAYCYLYGEGCEQNLDKVYDLLKDIAFGKQTFVQASDGTTITMDIKRKYVARLYIGIANYFDRRKPNHYEEAVKWLHSAMESEEASDKTKGEATCLLSRCYRFGRGVKQDIIKANELEVESKKLLSEEDYSNFSKKFNASY